MLPSLFEHDTFRPIQENAETLAQLLQTHLTAKHILLIAHSRGGLVARLAAHLVRKRTRTPAVEVYTCGTPYEGTPIVDAGARVLRLLYRAGAVIQKGIPVPDVATAAASYLFRPRILPTGITQMSPSSDFLAMLALLDNGPVNLQAWGGVFNTQGRADGYGLAFGKGFGKTAFGGLDNDLIVATASATAGIKGAVTLQPSVPT